MDFGEEILGFWGAKGLEGTGGGRGDLGTVALTLARQGSPRAWQHLLMLAPSPGEGCKHTKEGKSGNFGQFWAFFLDFPEFRRFCSRVGH